MEPGSLLFQEADLAFLVSEGQKENPVHGSLTTLHFLTFVNDALAKAKRSSKLSFPEECDGKSTKQAVSIF